MDVASCAMPCINNPCLNQGHCVDNDVDFNIGSGIAIPEYQCQCIPPFTGPQCQVSVIFIYKFVVSSNYDVKIIPLTKMLILTLDPA